LCEVRALLHVDDYGEYARGLVQIVFSTLSVQGGDKAFSWDDDGVYPDNVPYLYSFCLLSPGISGQELDQ